MNSKFLLKRIAALMLTAVMTLSMTSFAFEDVFAYSGDAELVTEAADDADLSAAEDRGETEGSESEESIGTEDISETADTADPAITSDADGTEEVLTEENQKEEQPDAVSEQNEDGDADNGITQISSESKSSDGTGKGDEQEQSDLDPISGFELTKITAGADDTVDAAVKWDKFEGAAVYKVSIEDSDKTFETAESAYTFDGLAKGQKYKVTITATDADEKDIASGNFEVCTYVTGFRTSGSQEELKYTAGQAKYNNKIILSWEAVPGADSYTVTKKVTAPDGSEIKDVQKKESQMTVDVSAADANKEGDAETFEASFDNLFPGRKYTFTVSAKTGDKELIESLPEDAKDIQPKLGALQGITRSSNTLSPSKIKFANGTYDLRSYAGQARNGWGVAQGGSSDGTYAYVLLANSYKQTGRVAKFRISNGAMEKVSGTLETTHGNGMTYDSRRHKLVVIGRNDSVRGNHKQELTVIDADSLTIVRQQDLNYSYFSDDSEYFSADQRSKGLAAISYSPKYDVYIAKQRDNNNLIVIDPDTLKAIGFIKTLVNQYGGSGQAMDGDDQFVYMLKSGYGSSNTNIVLTLDWNSNQLIDSTTGYRREFVREVWGCNNNLYPVAVYVINTPYEAENVYHYYDNYGREIFYMTEYDANQQYNITKTKKAYKAKWKKVKKKVKVKKTKKVKKKVKWKKVKTKKGKYKWKYKKKKVKVTYYKWKKKKVWLYKTKYKTVTTKTPTYKDRRDYVYYLGII